MTRQTVRRGHSGRHPKRGVARILNKDAKDAKRSDFPGFARKKPGMQEMPPPPLT